MGLFDKLKKERSLYQEIEKWLDGLLGNNILSEVVAICFNIYEDANNNWSLEMVGTSSFDENDPDWACDEITDFETRENPFIWNKECQWKEALSEVKIALQKYLANGRYASKLKEREAVGAGFVDGDLEIIFKK